MAGAVAGAAGASATFCFFSADASSLSRGSALRLLGESVVGDWAATAGVTALAVTDSVSLQSVLTVMGAAAMGAAMGV